MLDIGEETNCPISNYVSSYALITYKLRMSSISEICCLVVRQRSTAMSYKFALRLLCKDFILYTRKDFLFLFDVSDFLLFFLRTVFIFFWLFFFLVYFLLLFLCADLPPCLLSFCARAGGTNSLAVTR